MEQMADARSRLSALMQAHGDGVYAYSVRMLRDASLAADVLQQVFEQAYRDIGSLRDERQARSWLFGIAHHRCQDAIKARQRLEKRQSNDPDGLDAMPDAQPDAWERVAANQVAVALDACVRELSTESRTAVLLRFQEGMTYEHMATVCSERPATLQARVTRALPVLRRCLEAKGIEL
jgi:RNA polymerase sigma-70 factor (ECF subfamily)